MVSACVTSKVYFFIAPEYAALVQCSYVFISCSNMNRAVTYWYTKDQPIFENTDDMPDTKIDVIRTLAGSETPPCLPKENLNFGEIGTFAMIIGN